MKKKIPTKPLKLEDAELEVGQCYLISDRDTWVTVVDLKYFKHDERFDEVRIWGDIFDVVQWKHNTERRIRYQFNKVLKITRKEFEAYNERHRILHRGLFDLNQEMDEKLEWKL